MKIQQIISNDYFKLFIRREGKVVLGKNLSSLWLLSAVMFVTFLAISFSNASLNYLSYKMNDPFINWVDIKNNFSSNDFIGFEQALQDDDFKREYGISGYQTDKYWYSLFASEDKGGRNLKCRFFADINTPLVAAIMNSDNVVGRNCISQDKIINESYGVIITYSALRDKLGYDKIPSYIYYKAYCDPEAAEEFGVNVIDDHFYLVPIPVLAVVNRLPTNMDIIGTKFFYHQDNGRAFNFYEPSYSNSFYYFLPEKLDRAKVLGDLESITKSKTDMGFYTTDNREIPSMQSFSKGNFISLNFDYEEDVDYLTMHEINDEFMRKYEDEGVIRVYEYISTDYLDDDDDYISVHFENLGQIRNFQDKVKEAFKIDIDMSQINAKENFNAVSIMANILSLTMIAFAIVCIILFSINLLQSYFQKVKKNLGTFKAFGISNYELITIYLLIMIATIISALLVSLFMTCFIQYSLELFGLVRDGGFGYFSIWNLKTLGSIITIIAVSIATVYVVLKHLLKATPGDLIYDR